MEQIISLCFLNKGTKQEYYCHYQVTGVTWRMTSKNTI